jgi:hypothetical protein
MGEIWYPARLGGYVPQHSEKEKKPITMEQLFLDELTRQYDRQDGNFLYIVLQTLFFNSMIFKKVFYKIFVLFVLKWQKY